LRRAQTVRRAPQAVREARLAWAALDERRHALGGVLGREQGLEGVALEQQPGVDADVEAAVDRLLRGAQRDAGPLGEAGGGGGGPGVDLLGRMHLVDQADRQ
jgi:hypothetical protein